uniref:Uncharacterized protein n=1 Tax=Desulfobacca acetoxidans TaxID=60893 RepID=A0A7C3Z279_9BACT
MSWKKIVAGIFAGLILIKLAFLLAWPEIWLGMAQSLLKHLVMVTVSYLLVLAILGCYIFTRMDIIDVALVMLFTTVLIGLGLLPCAASLQTLTQEIAAVGRDKAWLAWLIWVAIAAGVLHRIFATKNR